ncbi:MAG: hypothetical protein J6X48_11660 [Lachnospiraceae bacterium]|nr:hypothetical protein [Lachnospiraceae bacterium]
MKKTILITVSALIIVLLGLLLKVNDFAKKVSASHSKGIAAFLSEEAPIQIKWSVLLS